MKNFGEPKWCEECDRMFIADVGDNDRVTCNKKCEEEWKKKQNSSGATKDIKSDGPMIQNTENESVPNGNENTNSKKTLKNTNKDVGPDISEETQNSMNKKMPEKEIGVPETLNVSDNTAESIMPEKSNDSSIKSKQLVTTEILQSESQQPSVTLPLVEYQSMNLIDDSAKHLFELMRGLHANKPNPEIQLYDPERIHAACACAKNIRELLKLKLEAIKLQRNM
ncbi:MAG: hypothetical protein ACHQUC_01320 [Chlamydiales bacterium]